MTYGRKVELKMLNKICQGIDYILKFSNIEAEISAPGTSQIEVTPWQCHTHGCAWLTV